MFYSLFSFLFLQLFVIKHGYLILSIMEIVLNGNYYDNISGIVFLNEKEIEGKLAPDKRG